MKEITIGRSDLRVSQICLGTMTWGTQNTEAEGHAQIDAAKARGINFMDTAEMYPVNPVRAETVGNTEKIIGTYFASRKDRADWILATKISGPTPNARGGEGITGASFARTLDGNLARLKTDYIDLYQLHWPQRGSYHFRAHWAYDPSTQDGTEVADNMAEVMHQMSLAQKAGKVREFGLSNETAWGTMQWLAAGRAANGPRIQSIQNEYSLLAQMFNTDMAELCVHEDITLLAYSVLGCGMLSGKYKGGTVVAPGTRMAINGDLGGRTNPRTWAAVDAYVGVAEKHGLNPATMAIAWSMTRPFEVSPIIGATTLEQLDAVMAADDLVLSDAVLADLAAVYRAHPLPF